MRNSLSYPPADAPIRNCGLAVSRPQGHSPVSYFLIDLIGSRWLRGRNGIQVKPGGAISPSYCLVSVGRTASHAS